MVVTVPTGEMTQSFTVAIVDDDVMECDETFTITILSVTGCAVTISNTSRTEVMIVDNDGRKNYIVDSQLIGLHRLNLLTKFFWNFLNYALHVHTHGIMPQYEQQRCETLKIYLSIFSTYSDLSLRI